MILLDLSNSIKKVWEKISFHKHFKQLAQKLAEKDKGCFPLTRFSHARVRT